MFLRRSRKVGQRANQRLNRRGRWLLVVAGLWLGAALASTLNEDAPRVFWWRTEEWLAPASWWLGVAVAVWLATRRTTPHWAWYLLIAIAPIARGVALTVEAVLPDRPDLTDTAGSIVVCIARVAAVVLISRTSDDPEPKR